ncbi:hypothetical protein [Paenibacillus sp. NPDC055715]
MKRLIIMFVALIMFLGAIPTINAEETNYRMSMEKSLQPGPRIENGSLMLPVVALLSN